MKPSLTGWDAGLAALTIGSPEHDGSVDAPMRKRASGGRVCAEGCWMVLWLLLAVGALVAGLVLVSLAFVIGMRAKSPVVLRAVKRFNRRFMNPRQMKTAGTPGAYAGVIRHVGRRSGRVYETPVGPFACDDGFVIALPYGTTSDWVKNVLAAGLATLVTEGQTYEVDQPETVPLSDVADVVPKKERRNLRFFHVEQALRLRTRYPGGLPGE
jgi:deazaflavin-dependent oxidoreductase (nitroreductase family)